jgi:MraZ protein
MVIGQYSGSISSGNRVSFPKKFRQILGKHLLITKGLDGNIIIVAVSNWKTLLEGTEDKPFTNKSARKMQALLLGNASEVVLDELGRFVIPEYLRRHAGIKKDVIFAGLNRYIQLWDRKRWDEYQKEIEKHLDTTEEELSGIE